MDIYPEDLGRQLEAEIRHIEEPQWKSRLPVVLPNTIGAMLLATGIVTILLWLFGLVELAVSLTVVTLILLVWYLDQSLGQVPVDANFIRSNGTFRNGRKSLTLFEIQDQRMMLQDPLIQKYLELVCKVIKTSATPDADAEREVRAALQALGNTVYALPADDPKIVTDDPVALRTDAAKLSSEGQAEPDAVIAASLHRRAESLLRRADTAARTLLLLRRNQVLRQETAEQIDALQTSLTAMSVGGRQSAPELSDLAASIQRVAHEANAITAARAEVDTLVIEPYQQIGR